MKDEQLEFLARARGSKPKPAEFILKEQVSTIAFLVEKDLLKEYVQWRFNLLISRKL